MKKRVWRGMGILLSVLLLFQIICEPAIVKAANTGVTVTTTDQFMTALAQKQNPITIEGSITIGEEADDTGKMYPVEIPAGTVIQGSSGASLDCRCPLQLGGDNVIIQNIELLFSSSDALGSVPHREIFLAGHSLTLDNVKTYLAGSGGSLGGLGGSEEELLPSVYAGGFENTSVGSNAVLTIQNANSETMFQGIYMSHDTGDDSKVPYTGTAIVNLCPRVTVREGVFTDTNTDADITISGAGNVTDVTFYGNGNTRLSISQTSLYRSSFDGVGELLLDENAYVQLQQDSLENVTLKNGACLDWNNRTDVTVQGNFTGGAYDEENSVDERGVLVLNQAGTLTVQGTVNGTTTVQTDNRNFPGEFTSEKQYIIADEANQGMGFVLPESILDFYELVYETNGWTVYELESDFYYPIVESIDIVYAPTEVDVSKIEGSNFVPPSGEFYCDVVWKDEEGNAISTEMVEELLLYASDTIVGIKTEYWQDETALEQEDWGNVIQFVSSPETVPNRYYFYVEQGNEAKTGDYTFLFCSEYYENVPITVADVKALRDKVKAEINVNLYDSTLEPPVTDIGAESIVVTEIEEQTYTGNEIKPSITVTDSGVELKEGEDYRITYENNIEVGENTAKVVLTGIGSYEGTREIPFTIVKCVPVLTLTANGEPDLEAEYEQEICFSLQISPYDSGEEGSSDSVEFYSGEALLGTAFIDDNGQASLLYLTTDRKIPVGSNNIRAEFDGTANLNAGVAESSVTLNKKTISLDDIASVSLKDFTCDDITKTTDILSVTDKNSEVYPVSGTAELADVHPGSYGTAKIISWLLNGEYANWYQLPTPPESIAVSPQVNILPKQEPDPVDIGAESIVVTEIEEQTYTGEEIRPFITVTAGGVELHEGTDYQVTYENNIEAGVNMAKVVLTGIGSYEGTREIPFTIVKCTPVLTLTANGETELEAEYEQEICFSLQISPYDSGEEGSSDSVEFYSGEALLGTAFIDDNGQASLLYLTTDRKIPVGSNNIRAEFDGTGNLNAGVAESSVTLNKKTISLDDIASVSLKDFTCDDITKTTDILSVTDKNSEAYPVSGTAELADVQPGSYGTAKIISWLLNGEYANWYQLPTPPESIAVSPQVNILPKPEPDPVDIGAESIVVTEIENRTYTGEEIRPSITVTDNGIELQESVDYQVTYENNVEVGENTAKVVLTGIGRYTGTREISFSIVKYNPILTLTANGELDLETEYEQEITFMLQVSPYDSGEEATADSVEFYLGETLLGSASIDENGQAVLNYQTIGQIIPIGANTVRAEYDGTANVNAGEAEVSVTLNKKTISVDGIASITLEDFTCDDITKTTNVLSITDKNGVVYPVTGTAELSDTQAGSYDTAKVISWSLDEEYDAWYQLPTPPESVAVSPQVNILPKPEPEPEPEPALPEHTHHYVASVTKASTCTKAGIKTYQCTGCDDSYTKELPLKKHNKKKIIQKAKPGKNGYTAQKCQSCGVVSNKKTIYAPKKVKLSQNDYMYNGKTRKPSVKVTDKDGKTIKKSNYTVTYQKNKNVGKATVIVRFKNNYSGSLKETFTINPKGTSVTILKAESKGFTVKWKKQSNQTSGYVIEYSTNSKFSKKLTKSITIKNNKSTSKTIKKLKANKKYYVRIRTFKTIKVNGKSQKLYSAWSKAKTVKTGK